MTGSGIAGSIVFVLGYIIITFEHQIKVEKAPTSLVMAGLMWLLVSRSHEQFAEQLQDAGWEITQIVFFLLFAMALVELISRLGFFEFVRVKLQERHWDNRQQFVVLMILSFFFSSILDNLTTSIVMVEIARRFFRGRNLLVVAAGVVIMANAGGAWSPIGDVTTIMLWLAGKFSSGEIILQGFLPSLAHGIVATLLLRRLIVRDRYDDSTEDLPIRFSTKAKILMTVALLSFSLPFVATQLDLPPFVGLGFGFGVVGMLASIFGHRAQDRSVEGTGDDGDPTRMQHDIQEIIRDVDFSSLIFFVGILLSVSALGSLGVLQSLSDAMFGPDPEFARVAGGNLVLGWGSAVVDNVPLTAMAIDTVPTAKPWLWTLLAYTVGTGGSHLIIGSAAGVVVMGRIKGLSSTTYMRLATLPVAIAYLAGVAVWWSLATLFS